MSFLMNGERENITSCWGVSSHDINKHEIGTWIGNFSFKLLFKTSFQEFENFTKTIQNVRKNGWKIIEVN